MIRWEADQHDDKTVATEPNDLGRYFIERANAGDVDGLVALYEPNAVLAFPPGNLATGHAEIRKVYEQFVAAAPVLSPGRQHPALVSGDLALTASTLTTGEVTVEIARRQPDGSWLWAVDQPALVPYVGRIVTIGVYGFAAGAPWSERGSSTAPRSPRGRTLIQRIRTSGPRSRHLRARPQAPAVGEQRAGSCGRRR